MSDLASVTAQMLAAGMPEPPFLEISGRLKRYGKGKRAWYVLHEQRTRGGETVITGAFGCWGLVDSTRVEVDWKGISEAERQAIQDRQDAIRKADETKRARRAAYAALRAGELWRSAAKTGRSAYLDRKQVTGESVRYLEDGSIVVPMIRYDHPRETALVGAQVIKPDGEKLFTPGTAKEGSSCRLGIAENGWPILVCEGLATGLSIRMATEHSFPVFVAFDAGNLKPVCTIIRSLYPDSPLLICADDDYRTFVPMANPGRTYAWKALRGLERADLCYPVFGDRQGEKLTDYNDWHVKAGLDVVKRHFERVISRLKEYRRVG